MGLRETVLKSEHLFQARFRHQSEYETAHAKLVRGVESEGRNASTYLEGRSPKSSQHG